MNMSGIDKFKSTVDQKLINILIRQFKLDRIVVYLFPVP